MKFRYGPNDWKDLRTGQEHCYLLTNGLGGFSSQTIIGSNSRNDHALFMISQESPGFRWNMISGLEEVLRFDRTDYILTSQEYVCHVHNKKGFAYLDAFVYEYYPQWYFLAGGVEINKSIVMVHGEHTIGINYKLRNHTGQEAVFTITPLLQFVPKGDMLSPGQKFEVSEDRICSNEKTLYFQTNGMCEAYEARYIHDLCYYHDARDGRPSVGKAAHNHQISITLSSQEEKELFIIYSTEPVRTSFLEIYNAEKERQEALTDLAEIQDPIGTQLVRSADQFIASKASTGGKTILAGYPFFEDWGRDTMIALAGCCIYTKRYEDAKSILRTFMKYCRNGLMPNVFAAEEQEAMYNTADAALLFVGAVYEYYNESKDLDFVEEAFAIMEDIIKWYQRGTDYHIRMDADGLIMAGADLEQVTWMDVRFDTILPTPRHGKPVEINAYWYNALKAMEFFARLLKKEFSSYETLAQTVRKSFAQAFWMEEKGYLKDVVSGNAYDVQLRCNQIWTLSQSFTMLPKEAEKRILDKVYEQLYTPYGLRSLSPEDAQFHPIYQGTWYKRDMAYHQGTVWAFPLGAYYLAYLKVYDFAPDAVAWVRERVEMIEPCLREGCVGQIAEIYDGQRPTQSRGCFAQAWSVSEILKIFAIVERDIPNSKE